MSTKSKKSNKGKFNLDKKKIIMIICAVAVIAAIVITIILLTGRPVETSVPQKYVDGFADKYASEISVDDDGNISYEFEPAQYEAFLVAYHEVVKEESRKEIESVGQYSHYNLNKPEIVVGVTPESYAELGEAKLKEEAKRVGQAAIKYQMNTENPIKTIPVTYRDTKSQDIYFTITVTAE